MGEDATEDVRRQHDSLTGAVTVLGGSMAKGPGDGILATFPGAAEAVGAEIAMQQALRRWNRRERCELAIRVGVSASDLLHENGGLLRHPGGRGVPSLRGSHGGPGPSS